MKFHLLFVCGLGLAATPAIACYTVYDDANRIVHQSQTPPVDMSLPLHQTLPKRFPGGGHLVFNQGVACQNVPIARQAPAAGETPLLTDARTAAALKLPHTILPSGAALVRQRPASMRPGGVAVIPSGAVQSADAAAEATPPTLRAGSVVITEMHNPPLTAVQDERGTVVGALR